MYGSEVHLDEDYIDQTLSLGDKNGDGKLDIDGMYKRQSRTHLRHGLLFLPELLSVTYKY